MEQLQIAKKEVKKTARQVGLATLLYNILFIGLIYLVYYGARFLFMKNGMDLDLFNQSFDSSGIPYLIAIAGGLLTLFGVFFKRGTHKEIFKSEKKMTFVRFGAMAGVYFLIVIIGGLLNLATEGCLNLFGYTAQNIPEMARGHSSTISMYLYTCLLGPIAEELVFRGYLLKPMQKHSKKLAMIVTSVLFGLMHGNLAQALPATMIGLAFSYIAMEYSLKWSILLHIFHNCFVTALSAAAESSLVLTAVFGLLIYGLLGIGVVTLILKRKSIRAWLKKNTWEKPCMKWVVTSVWTLLPVAYFVFEIVRMIDKI